MHHWVYTQPHYFPIMPLCITASVFQLLPTALSKSREIQCSANTSLHQNSINCYDFHLQETHHSLTSVCCKPNIIFFSIHCSLLSAVTCYLELCCLLKAQRLFIEAATSTTLLFHCKLKYNTMERHLSGQIHTHFFKLC